MKAILITVFSGVLLAGIAAAQDSASPAAGSPASTPQTSTPAPQQTQEPASQPQAQSQSPESQTPATQSSQEPSAPQSPQRGANSAPATGVRRIAPGSVIPVQLTKTIDAKKAKTGDEVVAKVTQDLKTNSGEVIVAKDTKVLGHVTEAQAHSKEQKESQVGIAFDRAVEKNGNEMQLPMSIQAIIGPENNGPQNNSAEAAPPNSAPTASAGGSSGRPGAMGGSAPMPTPTPSAGGGNTPTDAPPSARAPITAETKGVVGISNLKLEPGGQTNQGSVVSSEKNNVKLESGTMMLLRVNQ
jgi:hypothetical protein